MRHHVVLINGTHQLGSLDHAAETVADVMKRLVACGAKIRLLEFVGIGTRKVHVEAEFKVPVKDEAHPGFCRLTAESRSMDAVMDAGFEKIRHIQSGLEQDV